MPDTAAPPIDSEPIVDNFAAGEPPAAPPAPAQELPPEQPLPEPQELGGSDLPPAQDAGDPSAPPADPEPPAPEPFAPELLRAAGLTNDQAHAQFGNEDELRNSITQLDARFLQAAAGVAQAPAPIAPPQPQPWAQPQQPAQQPLPQTPAQQAPAEFPMPAPADGGEWDPDTQRLIQSLHAQHQSDLQQRDALLQQQQQALQQIMQDNRVARQQSYDNDFDQFINDLGPDWEDIFGRGSATTVAQHPQRAAFINRVHLDSTAQQLEAGMRVYNQPSIPRSELLARALRLAFPDEIDSSVANETAQTIQSRQSQFTSRPASHSSAARNEGMSREEKAGRAVEQFLRDRGVPVDVPVEDFDFQNEI